MASKDYSQWLTKAEAAQALQCGEKTIERLAARGKIQQAFRRVPSRRPIAVFHPKDIEKLKNETLTAQPFITEDDAASVEPTNALVPASQGPPANFLAALATALQHPAAAVTLDKKLFLSIEEAAVYSGLPKSHLRKLIKEEKIQALKLGRWCIRRAELEKL